MSWMVFLWWKTKKRKGRGQNVYSNLYSQAVTHPSTNRSQPCLTSVIGRELVYSRWYGRRHKHYEQTLKWLINQTYRGLCCAIWRWAASALQRFPCRGSTVRDPAEPTLGWQFFRDSTVSVIKYDVWCTENISFSPYMPLGKWKSAKCLQQPVFPGGHPSKY